MRLVHTTRQIDGGTLFRGWVYLYELTGVVSEGESLVIPQSLDVANLRSGHRREALRKAPKQVYLGICDEILSPLFYGPKTIGSCLTDPMAHNDVGSSR